MKRFVLDASIALAWFIDNPPAPSALHIQELLLEGGRAVVPMLWHLEVANGFMVAERRGTLTAAGVDAANEKIVMLLLRAAIETATDLISVKQAMAAARAFRLTAYDAVYLELAVQQDLPLASLDRQLLLAASKAGVEIVR